ncbi:hypothetical protein HRbin15_00242 [bacterium HR15]|nr:hypothetical protein HRbin15_00242 [bacterium HR15]
MIVRAFVDRIETLEEGERVAVLVVRWQPGDYFTWVVPLEWLPPNTKESHWLLVTFEPDTETQQRIHQQIEQTLKELQSGDEV